VKRPVARAASLLLLAGCASDPPLGRHGLPEKVFEMPVLGPCAAPPPPAALEVRVGMLQDVIGRYPPKYDSEAHREATYARWSEVLGCVEALPADRDAEKRLYLLAELYRQGHNMDVQGAAEKSAEALARCLDAFPASRALSLFPATKRADDFRKIRDHLGDEIPYREE
jgi:hypothetical protein